MTTTNDNYVWPYYIVIHMNCPLHTHTVLLRIGTPIIFHRQNICSQLNLTHSHHLLLYLLLYFNVHEINIHHIVQILLNTNRAII